MTPSDSSRRQPHGTDFHILMSGLERIGLAAWAVDAQLRILAQSSVTGRIAPGLLKTREQTLQCAGEADQDRLDRLVAAATGRAADRRPTSLILNADDGRRILLRARALGEPGTVLLWLRPLDAVDSDVCDDAVLNELFDFTPAERAFARWLLCGATVAEIAASTHVSLHTARDRLKTLFHKTGVRRQAELALLLERVLYLGGAEEDVTPRRTSGGGTPFPLSAVADAPPTPVRQAMAPAPGRPARACGQFL